MMKVEGLDADKHMFKKWSYCKAEPDIKAIDVATTINACLEAKKVMEAKVKKVDEWKLADNIDKQRKT